jgi:hypothetical protein
MGTDWSEKLEKFPKLKVLKNVDNSSRLGEFPALKVKVSTK